MIRIFYKTRLYGDSCGSLSSGCTVMQMHSLFRKYFVTIFVNIRGYGYAYLEKILDLNTKVNKNTVRDLVYPLDVIGISNATHLPGMHLEAPAFSCPNGRPSQFVHLQVI